MDNRIWEEEFTREQARLAARKEAEPGKAKKASPASHLGWLALLGLVIYTVLQVGGTFGLSANAFLARDFLLPALILTAGFLWFLVR